MVLRCIYTDSMLGMLITQDVTAVESCSCSSAIRLTLNQCKLVCGSPPEKKIVAWHQHQLGKLPHICWLLAQSNWQKSSSTLENIYLPLYQASQQDQDSSEPGLHAPGFCIAKQPFHA